MDHDGVRELLTGADTARGIWAMEDYVEWPEVDGQRVGLQGYGHDEEEYVREVGEWRIARTHLSRLRVDPLPPSPEGAMRPPR